MPIVILQPVGRATQRFQQALQESVARCRVEQALFVQRQRQKPDQRIVGIAQAKHTGQLGAAQPRQRPRLIARFESGERSLGAADDLAAQGIEAGLCTATGEEVAKRVYR